MSLTALLPEELAAEEGGAGARGAPRGAQAVARADRGGLRGDREVEGRRVRGGEAGQGGRGARGEEGPGEDRQA